MADCHPGANSWAMSEEIPERQENPARPRNRRRARPSPHGRAATRCPGRTAYRWATNPNVRRVVEACRRRVFDRTIRQMARRANWASHQLAMLAKGAESESVQFRAVRSICSDAVAVSKSSDLDYRMAEIEDALRDRAGDTGVPG